METYPLGHQSFTDLCISFTGRFQENRYEFRIEEHEAIFFRTTHWCLAGRHMVSIEQNDGHMEMLRNNVTNC